MRLLLLEPDARLRSQLRQRLQQTWPDAQCTSHPPDLAGPLPPEFLVQGFDAVLVGVTGVGKDALQPLTDLSSRRGFEIGRAHV